MSTPTPPKHDQPARGGFTFIEVMFAVLVLGVGVIMIAAMLPVAIRTAQETRDNAAGSAAIESGFHVVEQAYADTGGDGLPPTVATISASLEFQRPWTWPYRDGDWLTTDPNPVPDPLFTSGEAGVLQRTFGNRVVSSDPTLAWIPFVSRADETEPPQVALVAVRSRNIEQFPTSTVAGVPASDFYADFYDVSNFPTDIASPTLRRMDNHPLPILIATHGGRAFIDGVPNLEIDDVAKMSGRAEISNQQIREAAVEGAAVVVTDPQGRLRVYRLGSPVSAADAAPDGDGPTSWTLLPDAGLRSDAVRESGDPGDPEDDFSADAWGGTYTLGERDDFLSSQAPFIPAYLIGRGLENADPTNVAAPDGWDDTDNPHVGPTQVVRHLDGRPLR